MTVAIDFNINAHTPSRPVDLAGFNEQSISLTNSSVRRIDAGHLERSRGAGLLSEAREWLKHS